MAMAVVSRSRQQNIQVSLQDVLRSPSLLKFAETVKSGIAKLSEHEEVSDQGFELSPIQQFYFLASKSHEANSRFNQSFNLRLSKHFSAQTLQSAIQDIVATHSMLRARFKPKATGGWAQEISSVGFYVQY